ncbi:MAG: hypothetical protein BWY83_01980 [bacterium ADurb.Bin478]|nr:MAG: hypothetical protein BWY83_01980 [bacterium ADurb.Bin478]
MFSMAAYWFEFKSRGTFFNRKRKMDNPSGFLLGARKRQ